MANAQYGVITNWQMVAKQVQYYRRHLDVFIQQQLYPIKLKRIQKVMARMIGNCTDVKITCSRGMGKTWISAVTAAALCILYPGTSILVVSATAQQATLMLRKLQLLAQQIPNLANEIKAVSSKNLVRIQKDHSICEFKNGSVIESVSMDQARGHRAKVVWVDEALDVDQTALQNIVMPVRNAKRDITYSYDIEDYASKLIYTTSACKKNNPFYDVLLKSFHSMAKGDKTSFACALDYTVAVSNGITEREFFLNEKQRMTQQAFDIQYGCKYIGASSDSAFPYDLTDSCRTLQNVQLQQPKNSKSRYVLAVDLATSQAKTADNTIVSVIKFQERSDGSFLRKLVYMKSYHGQPLDKIANDVRHIYHTKFPNCQKLIYDARGLGDSFSRFFDEEWTDTRTGKSYPPLVNDDTTNYSSVAVKALHPIRAVQTLNQRIYTNLRFALQKHNIELPMNSRIITQMQNEQKDAKKRRSLEQLAIFYQADALQIEMGNIVPRVGASGNVLYDTPRATMHKDRYSSIAYANDYISELQVQSVKRHRRSQECIGFASSFDDGPRIKLGTLQRPHIWR